MFGVDFCVMLQNLPQAPVRLKVSKSDILGYYDKNKFQTPKRLRRFAKRQNVRKIYRSVALSLRFLNFEDNTGSGNSEFIAQK